MLESVGGKGMFLMMGIITFVGLAMIEVFRRIFSVSKEEVSKIVLLVKTRISAH